MWKLPNNSHHLPEEVMDQGEILEGWDSRLLIFYFSYAALSHLCRY
jgi:hypothetical protein